jgi:hypothetical protein
MTTTNISPAATSAFAQNVPAEVKPLLSAPTFRNWARTVLWTAGIVGICFVFYAFDKFQHWFPFEVRRAPEFRLFKNPATLSMRVFGIPIHAFLPANG